MKKKSLSSDELQMMETMAKALETGYHIKSTRPIQKLIEGKPHFVLWAENATKERFLIYQRHDGSLKYLPEDVVNKLRLEKAILTIKK